MYLATLKKDHFAAWYLAHDKKLQPPGDPGRRKRTGKTGKKRIWVVILTHLYGDTFAPGLLPLALFLSLSLTLVNSILLCPSISTKAIYTTVRTRTDLPVNIVHRYAGYPYNMPSFIVLFPVRHSPNAEKEAGSVTQI